MQGKSPLVQAKEPYGNLDMVTCRSFHPPTQSIYKVHPANNAPEGIRQFIDRGSFMSAHVLLNLL